MNTPVYFDDVERCAEAIIERVGTDIVMGLPLGLGKANHVANALYRRAMADPAINLRIMTGLTLETPVARSDLEARFLGPLAERLFGGYEELEYAVARREGTLPPNVQVSEFFMAPGAMLGNAHAQQNYISSNYTHAARDLIDAGINVIGQLVAVRGADSEREFSLSCNPDLTLDLERHMRAQQQAGKRVAIVGQLNRELPFMLGDAVVPPGMFDFVLDDPAYEFRLFGPPKTSVSSADYMIGIYSSALIRDGGTLQVGIGSLGDAVVYALQLRHENNAAYRRLLNATGAPAHFAPTLERLGGDDRFGVGLYMATEMLVDGFMHLFTSGILKRRVYPDLTVQRLLNEGLVSEDVSGATLDALLTEGVIQEQLSVADIKYLQRLGVLRDGIHHDGETLHLPDGVTVSCNLSDPACRAALERGGLGDRLKGGQVAHGGFFVGPHDFYAFLRNLAEDERELISMTSVLSVNQLYGNEVLDGLQRRGARFVNSCLMVTLSGAVVSDGLADGEVISGVGGQFNFVAMAHALPDGRSIIKVRSTRHSSGQLKSNIVWNHAHCTIPRHMRDLVVSEYGIAELRGKTDSEIIMALLNIADSRFQGSLLTQAKQAGKIPADYEIPAAFRHNLPDRIRDQLAEFRGEGLFPNFPYGTDLTDDEVVLAGALRKLKNETSTPLGKLRTLARAMSTGISVDEDVKRCLERMDLAAPRSLKEKLLSRLVAHALG